PGSSRPSVVTRIVSGPTSARISPALATMIVRHTPFTARLSPTASVSASTDPMRKRSPPLVGLRSSRTPVASMRPVNIAFNQHVRAQRLDVAVDQIARGEAAAVEKPDATGADRGRRDVQAHDVDEALVPGRL